MVRNLKQNYNGLTAIHTAAHRADHLTLDALLTGLAGNADILDAWGYTPLMWLLDEESPAPLEAKLLSAELLLTHGAHADTTDPDGNSSLHWAAILGCVRLVQIILKRKPFTQLRNSQLRRPIDEAKLRHHHEVVELLRNYSTDDQEIDVVDSLKIGRPTATEQLRLDVTNGNEPFPIPIGIDEENFNEIKEFLGNSICLNFVYTKTSFISDGVVNDRYIVMDDQLFCHDNCINCLLNAEVDSNDEQVVKVKMEKFDDSFYGCPPRQDAFVQDETVLTINETKDLKINNAEKTQLCGCLDLMGGKTPYSADGRLLAGWLEKAAVGRCLLFECSNPCSCSADCVNRQVQFGIRYRFELIKSTIAGFGIHCKNDLLAGSFLFPYAGEIISEEVLDNRKEWRYHWKMDVDVNSLPAGLPAVQRRSYLVDSSCFGNLARFVNHSCQPNCVAAFVYVDGRDWRFPEVCFFTSKPVKAGEELTIDYGRDYWLKLFKKDRLFCRCSAVNCSYTVELLKALVDGGVDDDHHDGGFRQIDFMDVPKTSSCEVV